jgi:phospholipase C
LIDGTTVVTLETVRDDDPLEGVVVPVSASHYPSAPTPSRLDKIQAARVSALPIRNQKGHYEEGTPPLSSAAEVADFIRDRSAAWNQHVQRLRQRRSKK